MVKSDRQILAELQEKASHPIADMLASMPEVAEFCRMSGTVYYLLLVVVLDMKAYVWLYRLSKANF
jgi:DNA-binding Lrp family transcriptional regulator